MTHQSATRSRLLLVILKLAVSAGLLAVLLARTDLASLANRFTRVHAGWAVAALGSYLLMVVVSAWRWRVLLQVQAVAMPLGRLTESFLVATFFNNFLPSNIGGDVVRVADTAQPAGSKTLAATVVLLDRAIGLVALFAVAAAGAFLAGLAGLDLPGSRFLWLPVVLAVAALLPALRAPHVLARLGAPLARLGGDWARERSLRLVGALERFGRRPSAIVTTSAAAVLVQALLVLFFLLTARSFDVPLPPLTAAFVVPVSLAAQMVPVSINGLGVRESVFAFFFAHLGLGLDAALTLSLGSAGLILFFSLSGGALFLLRRSQVQVPGAPVR